MPQSIQIRWIPAVLACAMVMSACAGRDRPRTAEDALAGHGARQDGPVAVDCVEEFGRPQEDHRGAGTVVCPDPVIARRRNRQEAESATTSPDSQSLQRAPQSIVVPRTPVPLGAGGGIGILR